VVTRRGGTCRRPPARRRLHPNRIVHHPSCRAASFPVPSGALELVSYLSSRGVRMRLRTLWSGPIADEEGAWWAGPVPFTDQRVCRGNSKHCLIHVFLLARPETAQDTATHGNVVVVMVLGSFVREGEDGRQRPRSHALESLVRCCDERQEDRFSRGETCIQGACHNTGRHSTYSEALVRCLCS